MSVWHYLAPNPKSAYKQLFLKGTRIWAEVTYGTTVDRARRANTSRYGAMR